MNASHRTWIALGVGLALVGVLAGFYGYQQATPVQPENHESLKVIHLERQRNGSVPLDVNATYDQEPDLARALDSLVDERMGPGDEHPPSAVVSRDAVEIERICGFLSSQGSSCGGFIEWRGEPFMVSRLG